MGGPHEPTRKESSAASDVYKSQAVIGTASQKEEEIKKALLPVVTGAKDYVLLDNLKGRLNSPSLEAFTTAQVYEDRILGSSKLVRGENLSTVFITGNTLRVSADIARRSLTIELFMSEEDADTRWKNKEQVDVSSILKQRSAILSALYCFVKEWHYKGQPKPAERHGSFPGWSKIIGGIVEAIGLANPCVRAKQILGGEPDSLDMRKLVENLVRNHNDKAYKFGDLVDYCIQLGCFERFTATENLDRSATAGIAKVFNSYADRVFQIDQYPWRFGRKGEGHSKRFFVEKA